jgi:cysteine desulfurase
LLIGSKPVSCRRLHSAGLMHLIYLDNNSTTPVLPAVTEAMLPFLGERFGNPASSHAFGRHARQALEDARERTAALLDAHADEVIFTSGATEANNLALFGLLHGTADSPHVIASPIEHPCVLEPLRDLAATRCTVDFLPVHREGVVEPDALPSLLRPEIRLVAVMLANHETGAIQPIPELAALVDGRAAFHCDAAAAAGKMPLAFHRLGVTTLTISAHKFHGPKGIGALLIRRQTKLHPLLLGGHQQHGRRPGTEPVALAVGLATALDLAMRELDAHRAKVLRLRRRLLAALRDTASPVVLNGPAEGGLPHTLNLSFPGCPADVLLMNLDLAGVACSTGSACSSGSLLPSPVLRAMGVADEALRSAMRFSLNALLTEAEIDEAARRIARVVKHLRNVRPDAE